MKKRKGKEEDIFHFPFFLLSVFPKKKNRKTENGK